MSRKCCLQALFNKQSVSHSKENAIPIGSGWGLVSMRWLIASHSAQTTGVAEWTHHKGPHTQAAAYCYYPHHPPHLCHMVLTHTLVGHQLDTASCQPLPTSPDHNTKADLRHKHHSPTLTISPLTNSPQIG